MARRINVSARGGASVSAGEGMSQGTQGGRAQHASPGAGMSGRVRGTAQLGDEVYLWILVLAEVGVIFWLRSMFSRYHGG